MIEKRKAHNTLNYGNSTHTLITTINGAGSGIDYSVKLLGMKACMFI